MKKTFTLLLGLLTICAVSHAGLITHQDYNSGDSITAAKQNTNENTVFNEFNGNIDNTNIKTGGVTGTNILDGTITSSDLNSTLTSTFTVVSQLLSYRRPVLQWISVTAVDIEANTGTTNQTCVMFPDERRCVTEDTSSTSVNRRFTITENGSQTGTKNSGLAVGEAEGANTWYALYACKATDNSTDFVVIGTTNTPVQANYARLNTLFGVNNWVYIGMIKNGDNATATSDILAFRQSGSITTFKNTLQVKQAGDTIAGGIVLSSATSSDSSWSYASGTANAQVPSHILQGWVSGVYNGGTTNFLNAAGSGLVYFQQDNGGTAPFYSPIFFVSLELGLRTTGPAVSRLTVLRGYVDEVLSGGINPQL